LSQREKGNIISPVNSIQETKWLQHTANEKKKALGIINNKSHQIEIKNTTPLVNDLEI